MAERIRTALWHWLYTVATAISRLGERLAMPWLTYNPLLFVWFHRVSAAVAPALYSAMCSVFPQAKRYADVGAGSGAMAAYGKALGLDVVACEYSPFGRLAARLQGVRSLPFDVTSAVDDGLEMRSDVAYCIEVAEHLPAQLGTSLVRFLAQMAPKVVFTAAHPGQGGHGHINEQPQSYWIGEFERAGMQHSAGLSQTLRARLGSTLTQADYLAENAMVFVRAQ
jgi:hypothetical protein